MAGLIVASLLYLGVFIPLRGTHFGQLFTNRGWVPFAVIFLTGWSVAILLFKWRRVRREQRAIARDVIPVGTVVRQDNVGELLGRVTRFEQESGSTILTRRVSRALNCFRARGSTQEVASLLASQAELDERAIESSYAMLRVFIWAVPILGFIGTVIGIGDAVSSFSAAVDSAQEIANIKTSLGGVTSGLAIAFDTTLVALVVSIVLMIPTNFLQKTEEDVLNSVSDCCNREILVRADEERAAESATTMVRSAMSDWVKAQQGQQDAWAEQMRSVGADLCREVAATWERIDGRMAERNREQADAMAEANRGAAAEAAAAWRTAHQEMQEARSQDQRDVSALVGRLSEEREQFLRDVKPAYEAGQRDLATATEALRRAAEEIGAGFARVRDQQADEWRRAMGEVAEHLKDLQRGLAAGGSEQLASVRQVGEECVAALRSMAADATELAGASRREVERQDALIRKVGDAATVSLDAFRSSLDDVRRTQSERLEQATEALGALAEGLPAGLERHAHALEKSMYAYEKLYEAQKVMGSNLKAVAMSNNWKTLMTNLDERLQSLDATLARLDGNRRPRTGWFGRSAKG